MSVPEDPTPTPVEITGGDGTIRLGQFLKLAGVIDSGADAKPLLAQGRVTVNGEPETRRGRQLAVGDRVGVDGRRLTVGRQPPS